MKVLRSKLKRSLWTQSMYKQALRELFVLHQKRGGFFVSKIVRRTVKSPRGGWSLKSSEGVGFLQDRGGEPLTLDCMFSL